MMTQTIEVKFENVNTLASQLRAAGAAIKVAKGNDTFNITITKQPILATIEEILTYSESNRNNNSSNVPVKELNTGDITPLEQVQELQTIPEKILLSPVETANSNNIVEVPLKESTGSTTKINSKKPAKSKQKLADLSAFADDDDIPF